MGYAARAVCQIFGIVAVRPPSLPILNWPFLIFSANWFHDPELRGSAGLQLNRGEHRQSLARWLFFANQGEFREGDYEEIMNKASCLSLISNAVLVWNTIQIQKIVEGLRASGHPVKDEDLARVSPLLRAHVIPNGSYDLSIR